MQEKLQKIPENCQKFGKNLGNPRKFKEIWEKLKESSRKSGENLRKSRKNSRKSGKILRNPEKAPRNPRKTARNLGKALGNPRKLKKIWEKLWENSRKSQESWRKTSKSPKLHKIRINSMKNPRKTGNFLHQKFPGKAEFSRPRNSLE